MSKRLLAYQQLLEASEMKPSRLRTPYEEFKICALCYTLIKELYRSNDLENNTEGILVGSSPKETLTFTIEPTVVKPILSFLQNH